MSFKCPDCGASLTDDSRFCKYCGAKIDDGVKRMEIKIDKRIEDVADLKRVEYEEQESRLRQKQMKRDMRKGKAHRVTLLTLLILSVLLIVVPLIINRITGIAETGIPMAFGICGVIGFGIKIISDLVTGKW